MTRLVFSWYEELYVDIKCRFIIVYVTLREARKELSKIEIFMAHDEHEVCNMGDLVMIVPCQKISRHKNFMVREIIRPKGQL